MARKFEKKSGRCHQQGGVMSKQFDKRVHRAVQKLMETAGDNCSICGREFNDRDSTYGGVDDTGQVQLTGKCCSGKLQWFHTTGIFLHWSNFCRGAA
jgi:hypothetical protein